MAFTIEDIRKIFVEENTNSTLKLTEELNKLNTTINEKNIQHKT